MNTAPEVRLSEVATFIRGITFKPDDVVPIGTPGSVACMRTKNVQSTLNVSDVWGIPQHLVKRADQFLDAGDMLVSSANSWNLVGKCCLVPELNWKATFGGFVSALRGDRHRIDARYFFHWFSSPRIQATVRSFGQQTTNISNLNIDRCLNLSIPLPPLSEQCRIAEVLDRAEALRVKRHAALTQLDVLTQAIFLDLFGNSAKAWPVETVANIAEKNKGAIRTGPFGSQLLHSEFTNSGIAVLGIDNAVANEFRWSEKRFISETKYKQLRRYTVKPGDVLITIMGTCGRCAVVPNEFPKAINTKHLCCVTLDQTKCLPAFLHAYFLMHPMAMKYLRQTAKGAIMSGLNMGIIQKMPIPIPPLHLQQIFTTRIEVIDNLKREARASLMELDTLFASLQHRAFRGELFPADAERKTKVSLPAANSLSAWKLDTEKGLEALIYAADRLQDFGFYHPLKALYLADKHHIRQHRRTLYGETHNALPMGPVPQFAYEAVDGLKESPSPGLFSDDPLRTALKLDGNSLIPLRSPQIDKFSAEEIQSLDYAVQKAASMDFEALKNFTHDTAYHKTPKNQAIQFNDILEMVAKE